MSNQFISVFNDILGPVMRGPSSSHTAASHRIGTMARSLLGGKPKKAVFTFDPAGSYGQVIHQQGVDLALASGLMEWSITDDRFPEALVCAKNDGIHLEFNISPLKNADHPNALDIRIIGTKNETLNASTRSTGGGSILFTEIDGFPLSLTGKEHALLLFFEGEPYNVLHILQKEYPSVNIHVLHPDRNGRSCVTCRSSIPFGQDLLTKVKRLNSLEGIRYCPPVFYIQKGDPLFSSSVEMVQLAAEKKCTLGELALEYEYRLLGLSRKETLDEMIQRFNIMQRSISSGFTDSNVHMKLLDPTARSIMEAEQRGDLPVGGPHARAAARALAVMHFNNSMGIVCAAPTGGSAGVIPGVVATLVEKYRLNTDKAAMLLFAASGIGLIFAQRATFAAEIAGCQVEIGAAGAMAAAAVIEASGGNADQAVNAAAICLQNSMGLVCDLVQGTCEIPCHTRNAAAASGAFTSADLISGGYKNPIPMDETIDAVLAVGKTMPSELRVTSLGGLAVAPSALSLKPKGQCKRGPKSKSL